jgi:hypothetical protein
LGRIGGCSLGDQNRPLKTIFQVEKRPLNIFDFFPIRAIVVAILARLASSGEKCLHMEGTHLRKFFEIRLCLRESAK